MEQFLNIQQISIIRVKPYQGYDFISFNVYSDELMN